MPVVSARKSRRRKLSESTPSPLPGVVGSAQSTPSALRQAGAVSVALCGNRIVGYAPCRSPLCPKCSRELLASWRRKFLTVSLAAPVLLKVTTAPEQVPVDTVEAVCRAFSGFVRSQGIMAGLRFWYAVPVQSGAVWYALKLAALVSVPPAELEAAAKRLRSAVRQAGAEVEAVRAIPRQSLQAAILAQARLALCYPPLSSRQVDDIYPALERQSAVSGFGHFFVLNSRS